MSIFLNYKFKKTKIFLILIMLCQLVSCQVEMPIKEMAMAKTAISRAKEVKAEKYAKEEYKLATGKLFEAHKFVKDDKSSDAEKSAKEALENANKAIEKSLPLLAKDKLTELETIMGVAEDKKLEKLAKEEYDAAKNFQNEAKDLYAANSFWDSYLKSQNGINKLQAALTIILAKVPQLREQISEIRDGASEISAQNGEEYAGEELAIIDKSLKIAENELDNDDVYLAVENINKAKDALEIAKENGKKYFAFQKIESAEKGLATINSSVFKKDFENEILEVDEAIKSAKTKFDEKQYTESTVDAEKALALIDNLNIALEKKAEEKVIIADEPVDEKDITGADEDGFPKEYVVELNIKDRVCLWKIAQKYYKNARLWPLIYMANRDKIKDPDLIFPGQKFVIPAVPKKGEKLPNSDFRVEKALPVKKETGEMTGSKEVTTDNNNAEPTDENKEDKIEEKVDDKEKVEEESSSDLSF